MIFPSFDYECGLAPDAGSVAGVDEVGRGPWAGPVVACAAVILDHDGFLREFPGVRDSKALSRVQRESLFERLVEHPRVTHGLGEASVQEIDTLNILQATLLAMRRALAQVSQLLLQKGHHPLTAYLVDGLHLPTEQWPGQTVVKGDQKSLSIATASILAKVTRDRLMCRLSGEFPGYGWERNAGYGTRGHQEALEALGVTPYHRRSFAPIQQVLKDLESRP